MLAENNYTVIDVGLMTLAPVLGLLALFPLTKALGRRSAATVIADAAAKAVLAKGFKAFKLDPFGTAQGFISREELELSHAICRTLRDKLPKDTLILIDVHARFTEVAALQAAQKFADLGIYWWEEPTSRDRQETVHEVAHRSPIPKTRLTSPTSCMKA